MDIQTAYTKKLNVVASSKDGVFVKGNMRFMITDHLQVIPVSTTATVALLNQLGIVVSTSLEESSVSACVDKACNCSGKE